MQKTLQEVADEFKSSIVIPFENPSQQFFFCPVGLVGAGKSTVIKLITEKFHLVRISSDELRKLLKENGYGYSSVKEIGVKIITDFAKKGYSIAFDMDCGNPLIKELVEKLAEELNIKVFFVHINSPEEYIFDKFRKHPPSWLADNPQTMIDNYYAQKETRQRENTAFSFFYTFDPSKPDFQKQIEDCSERMEKELRV